MSTNYTSSHRKLARARASLLVATRALERRNTLLALRLVRREALWQARGLLPATVKTP